MLCAAWECYNEQIIIEAANCILKSISSPYEMPQQMQKFLSKEIKNSKDELSPLKMAGEKWRETLIDRIECKVMALNTPKKSNICELHSSIFGIEGVSDYWGEYGEKIQDFVSVRGEIAHNGRRAQYVRIGQLREHIYFISRIVSDFDNSYADVIKKACCLNAVPWRRTAKPIDINAQLSGEEILADCDADATAELPAD